MLHRESVCIPIKRNTNRITLQEVEPRANAQGGEPGGDSAQAGHHAAVVSGQQSNNARSRQPLADHPGEMLGADELGDVPVDGGEVALCIGREQPRGQGRAQELMFAVFALADVWVHLVSFAGAQRVTRESR